MNFLGISDFPSPFMSANAHPKFNTWQILEMVRRFVWKKLLDCKACHKNLLIFLRFELLPNFIISNATDLKAGSCTCLVPILSISGVDKVLGIKFKGR